MKVRVAENKDFVRLYGIEPPPKWRGYVGVNGNVIIGMGGIIESEAGNWGFFDAIPGAKVPVVIHRLAKRLLSEFNDTVNVVCDTKIANAEKWLLRLGFKQTDEEYGYMKVWVRNG